MSARPTRAIASLAGLLLLVSVASASALDVSGLTHLDGSQVGSNTFPENAILVFFATWSPKCRGIAKRVNAIHEEWGETAPVFLVDFQEDRSAVDQFLAGKTPDVTVLLDPRAVFSKTHSITSLPGLLAIKDGTPAFRGKLPSDADSILRPIYE